MELLRHLRELTGRKYTAVLLGAAGILLVLLSSVLPGSRNNNDSVSEKQTANFDTAEYCRDTENRLEEFLSSIEGAGKVRVILRIADSGQNVYASEGRRSESDNRKEVEEKYVMVNESGGRTALLETVREPDITGAAVLCTGGSSPAVQERIYCALEALLGLSAGRVYVTKLE